MNAIEAIKRIEMINLPKDEFYVFGDTALVIYGIIKDTKLIQLSVSEKLFYLLIENELIRINSKDEKGFYKIKCYDQVRICVKKEGEFRPYKHKGIRLQNVWEILTYTKHRLDYKSTLTTEWIEKFLRNNPKYPVF